MKNWEEKLKYYDALIETQSVFKRKGKTVPYTSANGYMFSQVNKAGEIGIRLPKEMGKKFMEDHQTDIFKSYGAVMKDYVLIPDSLYDKPELLCNLLLLAYEYVMSLDPK